MADSPGLFTLNARYSRTLTVDHLQVPSTQSDFPVLVSFTNATFKTISNNGHVNNVNGYDIGFYSDSNGATKLKWEMEFYDAVNGIIVAWVKLASISSVSDTVFYMFYGDVGITTDQSDPFNVWTNSFVSVYHLKDGTTLSVADSRVTNNGTNNGVTAAAGQIDGCGGFASASSQYVALGTGFSSLTALTLSAWAKGTTFPNDYNGVINRGAGGTDYWGIYVKSTGKLFMIARGAPSSYDGTGTNTLSAGTWYFLTMTYDTSAGLKGYVNAGIDATPVGTTAIITTSTDAAIGRQQSTATRYFNGSIDEVRVASIARSADWITCEYNNQKTSSTFVALGAEA